MKEIQEYIWLGGNGEFRSKVKVEEHGYPITEWNYDGSSTGQASDSGNTEINLRPVYQCINPLANPNSQFKSTLVLCDTYDSINNLASNRETAVQIFNQNLDAEPWFGLEQEYFFSTTPTNIFFEKKEEQGRFYCGVGLPALQRKIVEEHLEACLTARIQISGTNAEVAPNQWEFQIGPCEGIAAADQLLMARYLLERIAEKHGLFVCYEPKPFSNYNGSGCHANFSTVGMREAGGISEIVDCMAKLESAHQEHLAIYGNDNAKRLTGKHETSSMDKFTYGYGTRNTSVRIPNQVVKNGCGYFEDRRPASNMNPYLVTSAIFKTCCLIGELRIQPIIKSSPV
jgi:glutamine synthetase